MTRAIFVAASECNYDHLSAFVQRNPTVFVIAIDGGYDHLSQCDISPDLVLGDFDSLGYRPAHPHTITFPSKKDQSDLELAFIEAQERGIDELYIYGALGRRLDHTLASINVAASFSKKGMRVHLIDKDCALSFLIGPDKVSFSALERGIVSLFALGEKAYGLTIKGLMYEVEDIELECFTSLGLSNEFIGKPVLIAIERGALCIIHPLALL